jgi:hypothetical protein
MANAHAVEDDSATRSVSPERAKPLADLAQDRVALGRYRPRAPTDPYVLALEHTVPQIMSLRECR